MNSRLHRRQARPSPQSVLTVRLPESPRFLRGEGSAFCFPHSFCFPYTLPSSVYDKSFVCHSYENNRGVPPFFPFWNASVSSRPSSLVYSELRGAIFLYSLFFQLVTRSFPQRRIPNSFPINRLRTLSIAMGGALPSLPHLLHYFPSPSFGYNLHFRQSPRTRTPCGQKAMQFSRCLNEWSLPTEAVEPFLASDDTSKLGIALFG